MDERAADRTPDTGQDGQTETLSATAAAAKLGVHERTIRRSIERGELRATKRSGVYRIAPDDLARYRERRRPRSERPIRDTSGLLRVIPFPEVQPETGAGVPRPATSLIGREAEVAAVSAKLRVDGEPGTPWVRTRLLTLTGPGGVGKTRLAVAIAEAMKDDFPDGVWFVGLAPVRDPGHVVAAIAAALGVREATGRPVVAGLQAFLCERRALLVLDNLEHILDAAPVVTELLAACPRLAVLATSRAALRLSGEHVVAVSPLALPDIAHLPPPVDLADVPAVRLFVERASAVRDDFALSDDNALAVAQICHRLDGLPLAIELAAARSRVLPPVALLTRLERGLPLLVGGPRDVPARLQTMREAIAWSHDLLTEEERILFRRLAVFVGGCSREAAEAVCGPQGSGVGGQGSGATIRSTDPCPPPPDPFVLDGVASLVDKSLLRSLALPVGDGADRPLRFGMLETVREFALDQLTASGEAEAVGQRHADCFLALAETAAPALHGPAQVIWLDRLEAEHGNLRAALAGSLARVDAATASRFVCALWYFWLRRGHRSEAHGWLERLLPVATAAPPALRTRVFIVAGEFAEDQGDFVCARASYEEALAIAQQAHDAEGIATALSMLGQGAHLSGDEERAAAYLEDALARWQALGSSTWWTVRLLFWLGEVAQFRGDRDGAADFYQQALNRSRAAGDAWGLAWALEYLGWLAIDQEDYERATTLLREGLALFVEKRETPGVASCLRDFAELAGRLGQPERAARLFAAVEGMRAALGLPRVWPIHRARYEAALGRVRGLLDEAAFAAAWAEGTAMAPAQVLAEAERVSIAVAAAATVPVAGDPGPAAGLTPRELEVLRLLAEGKSDREIGAALFVSRRTAATHVAAILRKFGLTSRVAAAAYAVRHGLA